ncbi:Ig-like domain-containing protein [Roseateles sp. L2-2]|uniref:Ig-like domain-containing protein n=1 Tax=Roseateles sp. L2-2 TaxID=3422597 RepID=UPI003D369D94
MTTFATYARALKAAVLGAFVAGTLAACGGGGGNAGDQLNGGNGGTGGGTGTVAVADVSVVLSKTTMANDGSETLTLTATALDANRGGITNATLRVAITDPNNSVFSSASTLTTDSSGKGTATISLGSDRSLRTVTVNVAGGSVTKSATFNVIQTTTPTTEAAELGLSLDKYTASNSGSDTIVATATAVDANRNVLSGVQVAFAVNNGATVAVVNGTTNAAGQAVANVKIGTDKSNRIVTVTASSGTLTKTASFQVSGAKLTASAVPSTPNAGSTGNTVQFRLSDTNDNAISGQVITITAPGQTAVTGTTDNSGAYTYTYTAPTAPGAYNITAVGGGVTTVTSVIVSSTGSVIPPVTTTAASTTFSANPQVIAVNATGSTTNRVELRTIFQAANNAPLQNIRVRYEPFGAASISVGGTISSGTSLVYSDASGNATSSYYPGTTASATNGLTIRACWDYTDFAVGTCPNALTATITVVSSPLAITIGTDATLQEGTTKLTYIKRFVVLVVDAAGRPAAGVDIQPLVDLKRYYKGFYAAGVDQWLPYYYVNSTSNPRVSGVAACLNEDDDNDGSLDAGEDRNGNGVLEPRKSDVQISYEGSSAKTDASGQLVIKIEYAKSLATWVDYVVTASATGVLSPPATYPGRLSALGTDFSTLTSSPPFQNSPYGRVQLSTDTVGSYCTGAN